MTGVQPAPELGRFAEWLSARAARGVASEASVPVPWTAPAAPGPVILPREQVWGYVSGFASCFKDLCRERGLYQFN